MKEHDKITFEEKKQFLEGPFFYEVTMLIYSYFKLLQLKIINIESEKNIAIETFIMHCRNLYEFYFLNSRIKNDDAKFFDYISVDNFNKIKDNLYLNSCNFKDKSNKQLAHLTYTRLEYDTLEKKVWEIEKIMKDFVVLTKYFINDLCNDFKGENINYLNKLFDDNPNIKILF